MNASKDSDFGGANPSYRGYDYQKLVTVWVALDLMFGSSPSALEIIVEPASHDDVKAKLEVSSEKAEANLRIPGTELHVQIKLRGAGHWSAKDFASVVNDKSPTGSRGPSPRQRAKALLLTCPKRRYLFITNTSVDRVLSGGRVQRPQDRPAPDFLPTNLSLKNQADRISLSGRFGLIELMTPPETRRRIDILLTEQLHLPSQQLDECVIRLKRLVEDRLLEVPDPLRRNDIRKVVESLGGLPHPDPELSHYVPPSTRDQAEHLLNLRGAVLLVGPAGYGKSLTAKSLAYDRRRARPPFEVIREIEGLAAIEEALAKPGRFFFHLEDPWGQSGLDADASARWTSGLPALLRHASPEKQFVITSRTEVYRLALGSQPAPVWSDRTVTIDATAYDESARRAILHGKLRNAGSWRRDLAREHETRLLHDLRTPMEIDGFVRQLTSTQPPAVADIGTLIGRAQTDSRRSVVVDQVRGFADAGIRGAAVLWALLRLSRDLKPDRLRALRRAVDKTYVPGIALDELAEYLAQTQLTRGEDGAYNAHSKVIEALEGLARDYPRAAETALNVAAHAICDLVPASADWLDELQRVVDGARTLKDRGVDLDADVVEAVDKFLSDALFQAVDNPNRFRRAWGAANSRLSDSAPIGRLVRWLERGAPKPESQGGFEFGWRVPKVSKLDVSHVLTVDPKGEVLKGFIAHVLPWTSDNYDADVLLPWLEPFGFDLTHAFLKAGDEIAATTEFAMNADTIAEGALAGPKPPYTEVWAQVEKLDKAVDAVLNQTREERRQAWQGELNFAVQLQHQERAEEEGPAANHYAKGYVRARRRQESFTWIPQHARPDLVMPLWAEVMNTRHAKATAAELEAFFDAAGNDDRLQAAGLRVIGERRLAFGRHYVLSALRSGGPHALEGALHALSWLESDPDDSGGRTAAESEILEVLPTLTPARAATLAPLIADRKFGQPEKSALAARVLAAVSPAARAAVQLSLAEHLGADDDALLRKFRELGPMEAQALISEGPRPLARLLLQLSAAEGADVTAIVKKWLASNDSADARAALHALVQGNSVNAREAMAGALRHTDYKVRREAMNLLARDADSAEQLLLLNLANDKSAPVRERLAELICIGKWSDGLATLTALLGDHRDYTHHPERLKRDEPEFNVARTAARSLKAFRPLPQEVLQAVITRIEEDADEPRDVTLHAELLDLLIDVDHPRIWPILEFALRSGRVVGENNESLYPIRYAAAWAIANRLQQRPTEIDLAPWADLEAAANHLDPQFAAPALFAIGLRMTVSCEASTLAALRGENGNDVRRALALAMFADKMEAKKLAVRHALLPEIHPLWPDQPDVSAQASSLPHWPLTSAGRSWLEALSTGNDVEAVLQWVLTQLTGLPLSKEGFDPTALRRQKVTQITTFAEMFGME